MRQLFPTNSDTPYGLPSDRDEYVTQSEYDNLVSLVNQYEQELQTAIGNFDQWKSDIQQAFTTGTLTANQLNAITADICSLITNEFRAECICGASCVNTPLGNISCIYADNVTVTGEVHADTSTATNANITNANITNANIDCLSVACPMTFNEINATTTCATNAEFVNGVILNGDFDSFCSDTGAVCGLDIGCACVTDATICNANVTDALNTYKFNAEFITHNDGQQAQTLVTPDDFYVELPYFSNGSYKLISKDANQEELWSITVHNESGNNFVITWSGSEALDNYLEDLYIYQNRFYFHGHSNNKAQTIYHMSDTTDNVTDPTIYTDYWPFDPTSLDVQKYWVFQFAHGTKFFRNVSFANDTAITSPLRLINCDDVECTNLPKTYDTTEDTNVVLYQPDQNVNTTSCVVFNRIETRDYTDPDTSVTTKACATHPHLNVTEDITAPSLNVSCACIDKTTVPNGLVIDCEGTFIKSTGEDTCDYVNPIATLKADECWECADCGLVAYDKNTNSLRPADDVHIVGNLTVECVLTACGPVIACQDVTVACDLHVNGDAFIAGTLHYTEEETINSTADNIILRQNNPTPLAAGQHSGLIINNATATSSTAIAVDCTGTVRVGNATASNTTYTDIYLSEADGKWYSDAELTTEVTPNGDLTAWSSTEKTEDYTHYTNAVFTVYSISSTQPLATRDEEANMVDEMPVIWDASCNRVVTTAPANGCACMGLVTCINEVTGCLGTTWQDMHPAAVSCRYACMANFEADKANIPNNAFVIIDDQFDVIMSEDK